MRHVIGKVQPIMLRKQPDQFCAIMNSLIDAVNELQQNQKK